MAPLLEEEENYVRLALLLKGVSPRAIRTYFDREFPPTNLPSTLNTNYNTLNDLKCKRLLNQAQWNLLFPRNGVPVSTTFDVTLMICLIRNLKSQPINGFPRLPPSVETTPEADLARIQWYRNVLAHHDSNKMANADFNTAWSNISDAVSRLGGQLMKQECQELKVKILEQSNQEIMLEIKQSQEKIKELIQTVDILGAEHSETTSFLRQLQNSHSTLQDYYSTLQTKHLEVTGNMRKLQEVTDILKDPVPWNIRDDIVPTEIKLMADKSSVPLYLKLLEFGAEKKRHIRVVVVGKKGAGKTSFINRLFSIQNTDVSSTNGIVIHLIKFKAMADDGIWIKLDGTNEETDMYARLLKPYKGTIESSVQDGAKQVVGDNTTTTCFDKTTESEPVTQQSKLMSPPITTETSQQGSKSIERAERDIENMLKSNVDIDDKEEYATLLLWDFAGDEDFYHTHQTFLSPDAIYIVVTKLDEADDKEAQEMFQLWMNSIHCYCRLDDAKNKTKRNATESEEQTKRLLEPPVVLVGSHKDKMEPSEGKEIETACEDCFDTYASNLSEEVCGHISKEFFISNIKDDEIVFQKIRLYILNLARKMKTWNTDYPLKFVQLEKSLQEKKKELPIPIISLEDIKNISTKTAIPLTDEELMLYLKFHHEIRALVYFEDLPQYIVLDTQWLSDAFKIIVTADKFRSNVSRYRNKKQWEDLRDRGVLHSDILEDIFKVDKNISKYKDYILDVMEKFDIIIRPDITDRDVSHEKRCYYVPCMITNKSQQGIYEMFNVTDTCTRSTWLCFMFQFLPPHLINHLIASLCREYEVAEVAMPKQKKRQIALFKGIAVFELQKTTKLRKLLVVTSPNSIQIQVLEFGGKMQRDLYKIDDFVTNDINKILSTRFKMSNVKFEKKWECGLTEPEFVMGSNCFSEEQNTEYYCGIHKCKHIRTNEWSKQPDKTYKDVYEKETEQKGLVLIVNFMFSGKTNERQGSDLDVTNLTVFFRDELGYQVECQSDRTKKDLQKYFQTFEKSYLTDNSKAYHSFICIVMSHGDEKGIQTIDEQGVNEPIENQRITMNEIQNPFKNKPGGKFNGKPKIFLIQACRGQQRQEKVFVVDSLKSEIKTGKNELFPENLESKLQTRIQDQPSGLSKDVYCTDAPKPRQKLPTDADVIVAYATTPDYISIRNIEKGSNFIRAFLYVARKHYRFEDIEEILRRVRKELATNPEFEPESGALAGKCQMGMLESTSTKKFFL